MALRYETYDDPETLRKLYWEIGLTQSEIANEFGESTRSVQRAMYRYDIATRGRGRQAQPYAKYTQRRDGYEAWEVHERTVYVHQLLAIAGGSNPKKVFSSGEYVVHHENGIPWDNREENLEVMSRSEHVKEHFSRGDIPPGRKYTDDELLEWIDSFKQQLGVVPRADEMDSCPGPCAPTYVNRFGSWSKAVRAAGYEPRGNQE